MFDMHGLYGLWIQNINHSMLCWSIIHSILMVPCVWCGWSDLVRVSVCKDCPVRLHLAMLPHLLLLVTSSCLLATSWAQGAGHHGQVLQWTVTGRPREVCINPGN